MADNIILYTTDDGRAALDVTLVDETAWLTQKQMAELFDRDRKTITRHISNIFTEGELVKESVCSYFEHTAGDGLLYKHDGTKKIADNALAAITLMIAEFKPQEKDLIVRVVVNLINKRNG